MFFAKVKTHLKNTTGRARSQRLCETKNVMESASEAGALAEFAARERAVLLVPFSLGERMLLGFAELAAEASL
jgi:hypothetical protein